jgi:hypothetical protein
MTRRQKWMVAAYTMVGFIALGPSFWLMARYTAIERGVPMEQVSQTCGWSPRKIDNLHSCGVGRPPHGYHAWEDWLGLVKVQVGWRYHLHFVPGDVVATEIAVSKRLTFLGFEIAADRPSPVW